MKPLAYLLILLSLSAQVDTAWVLIPDSPSASLSDENDDYLPGQRWPWGEPSSSHQVPMFVGLKPQTKGFSAVRRGAPYEGERTAPFIPPPHALLSLQI